MMLGFANIMLNSIPHMLNCCAFMHTAAHILGVNETGKS